MIPLDTFLLLNVAYGTDGTWYNWDMGWTIINEEAGADGTGALERTYVGKTLAHADGTNPATGTWRYYHMDAQGSVGLVTDPSRTVKAAFAYRPYGELYANTGSEVGDITHRYAQLEWDPTVIQYYAPYRWYHPRLSRWTTRDPLGMVDGPNVYAYVMGDPVNAVDPMGLKLSDCLILPIIYNAYNCGKCIEDALELVREAADSGKLDAEQLWDWFRAAKPGQECVEICNKALEYIMSTLFERATGIGLPDEDTIWDEVDLIDAIGY